MHRSRLVRFSLVFAGVLGAASAVKAAVLLGGFQGATDPTDAGWSNVNNGDPITSDPNSSFPAAGVPGYAQSLDISAAANAGSFGYPSLKLSLSSAQITAFIANSYLTWTFSVPGGTYTGGYNQIYNLAFNDGSYANQSWTNASETGSTGNDTAGSGPNFYFNDGANSLNTQTITFNYSSYLTPAVIAAITAPTGFLQITFQGNQGGGAPTDQIYNNVELSTGAFGAAASVPEPASLGLLSMAGMGLLSRWRRRTS